MVAKARKLTASGEVGPSQLFSGLFLVSNKLFLGRKKNSLVDTYWRMCGRFPQNRRGLAAALTDRASAMIGSQLRKREILARSTSFIDSTFSKSQKNGRCDSESQ